MTYIIICIDLEYQIPSLTSRLMNILFYCIFNIIYIHI